MQTRAKYLVKMQFEEKPRPVSKITSVEHPMNVIWLELTQESGDVLLVDRFKIDYILLRKV